jgi:catechol 2,3-dioxygenase-like lactoylglutathione lyase family enzyme
MRQKTRAPELLGLDHVYLAVSNFERSRRFYDRLMNALGFKKGTAPIGGAPHCHYYNRNFQISIRPARRGSRGHDSYAPGLHHLCLRVANNAAVDEIAQKLRAMKIATEGPRLWPEYAPDYYALFFEDPDGIRFEVMNYRSGKKLVRKLWDQLDGFVNPMDRLQRKLKRTK